MEYYSTFKKREILSLTTTWMNSANIVPSETSQAHRGKYRLIALTCGI